MAEFQQIYDEKKRKSLFKKYVKKIKKALENADPDRVKMNEQLIDEAAMYATNLQEINEIISRDGVVDFYKNGENQYGTKKSVAAELKPKYTATYQSLIRQLTELLPSEAESSAEEEIKSFLMGD